MPLSEVVAHYYLERIPSRYLSQDIPQLNLEEQEKRDLFAFMEACTGSFPRGERDRLP
jgi:hypothetical protein